MIDRFGLLPDAVKLLFSVTELKLMAVPLGIVKIDAGAENGRLIFGAQPNVDPEAVIRLIQSADGNYSLEGSEKMRFRLNMNSPDKRLAAISGLLQKLSGKAD